MREASKNTITLPYDMQSAIPEGDARRYRPLGRRFDTTSTPGAAAGPVVPPALPEGHRDHAPVSVRRRREPLDVLRVVCGPKGSIELSGFVEPRLSGSQPGIRFPIRIS